MSFNIEKVVDDINKSHWPDQPDLQVKDAASVAVSAVYSVMNLFQSAGSEAEFRVRVRDYARELELRFLDHA